MATSNTIKEFRAWITPSLVLLVGWFAKNKLEEIQDAIKLIPSVQQQINIHTSQIQANAEQVSELKTMLVKHVDMAAKTEEEITFDKLKKSLNK